LPSKGTPAQASTTCQGGPNTDISPPPGPPTQQDAQNACYATGTTGQAPAGDGPYHSGGTGGTGNSPVGTIANTYYLGVQETSLGVDGIQGVLNVQSSQL